MKGPAAAEITARPLHVRTAEVRAAEHADVVEWRSQFDMQIGRVRMFGVHGDLYGLHHADSAVRKLMCGLNRRCGCIANRLINGQKTTVTTPLPRQP